MIWHASGFPGKSFLSKEDCCLGRAVRAEGREPVWENGGSYQETDCGAGLDTLWDASAIKIPVRFASCARRWGRISPQARGTPRGQVHLGSAFRAYRCLASAHFAFCHRCCSSSNPFRSGCDVFLGQGGTKKENNPMHTHVLEKAARLSKPRSCSRNDGELPAKPAPPTSFMLLPPHLHLPVN